MNSGITGPCSSTFVAIHGAWGRENVLECLEEGLDGVKGLLGFHSPQQAIFPETIHPRAFEDYMYEHYTKIGAIDLLKERVGHFGVLSAPWGGVR